MSTITKQTSKNRKLNFPNIDKNSVLVSLKPTYVSESTKTKSPEIWINYYNFISSKKCLILCIIISDRSEEILFRARVKSNNWRSRHDTFRKSVLREMMTGWASWRPEATQLLADTEFSVENSIDFNPQLDQQEKSDGACAAECRTAHGTTALYNGINRVRWHAVQNTSQSQRSQIYILCSHTSVIYKEN